NRCREQLRHAAYHAGVHDMHHAFNGYLQHQLRLGIEEFRAIDCRQMQNTLNTLSGFVDHWYLTDIAGDQVDLTTEVRQPPPRAARVIIQYPHPGSSAQ